MTFSAYNEQFNELFSREDVNACINLFKSVPYSYDTIDYHMLETLNLNFENYDSVNKEALLNYYISSLESKFDIYNQMIIASMVEDLLDNHQINQGIWNRLINANLTDKVIIGELFETLDIRENPKRGFQLFQKYPDYGLLLEVWIDYRNHYNEQEKEVFLDNYISILNSNSKAAKEVILYSLWVDFFEDRGTQEEVWIKLMAAELNKEAIKSLFKFSGPVLFERKIVLIKQHLSNLEMHSSILMCLFGSLNDVYGDISFHDARNIFKVLKVDSSSEYYTYLKEQLFKFNSKKEYWIARNKGVDSKTKKA